MPEATGGLASVVPVFLQALKTLRWSPCDPNNSVIRSRSKVKQDAGGQSNPNGQPPRNFPKTSLKSRTRTVRQQVSVNTSRHLPRGKKNLAASSGSKPPDLAVNKPEELAPIGRSISFTKEIKGLDRGRRTAASPANRDPRRKRSSRPPSRLLRTDDALSVLGVGHPDLPMQRPQNLFERTQDFQLFSDDRPATGPQNPVHLDHDADGMPAPEDRRGKIEGTNQFISGAFRQQRSKRGESRCRTCS